MSKIIFNDKQLKVINDSTHETIVSAGAGSGKTGTLVGKITHLLKKGVDLENFLVLTFTNKAAFDMKEKVRDALLKDESLKDKALLIDSAHIETFDAFALNFVKGHASYLNKESNLEILDDTIFNFTKLEIMEQIISKMMLEKNIFLELFSGNSSSDNLINNLVNLYSSIKGEHDITSLTKEDILKDSFLFDFNEFKKKIDEDFLYYNEDLIETLTTYFNDLNNNTPTMQFKSLRRNKPEYLYDLSNELEIYLNIYKSKTTPSDVLLYKEYLNIFTEQVVKILKEFDQRLETFKEEANKYDFSDISGFVIKILENNPNILKRLRDKFHYIFIDEYQDTSKVQSLFLDLLINDNPNVKALYVGDIKQSIYKFRDAKPEYFINKTKEANLITLTKNYRSSGKIVDFVNNIFSNIFTNEDLHDIVYKDNHEMEVGSSKYVEDSHSGVYFEEIYIGDDYKIKDIREEEVFTIAYKIKELIDKKIVKDYKDITILLRNSTQFYLYDDIFKYLNIPLQIQRETFVNKNYFLKVLSSALLLAKIIKDKDSDDYDKLFKFNYIALARSELFNISDYEIYKSFNSDSNIFSPLIMELVEKLSVYIDDYPNIIIIDKLLEIFDVKNKIIHSLDYKLKVIEIDYLYDIASALNDLNINNLEFIEYIYNLAYDNQNTSKIKVLHEAEENSVRITNFHQSKGLEYEVLFVGGLYNPLFNASNEPVISFDKELGITYKKDFYEFADLDNLKGLSGYNKFNILEKSLQETIKEELRLLYVAFTRAKRSLYVMSVFDEKYLELKSLNHYLYLSNVTNYVDGIKRYESSLREDYYGYKRTPLKYPKELDYIKENKYQVSYIEKEVKKASAEIKELIDDEVKKRLIKGTASHEKFEFANFFDLKNSGDKDLVNFYNTKFGNKYIKDAKDFITEYEFYDSLQKINGIIDLLVIYDDEIHIIDYKASNIDDPNYVTQLQTYIRYLSKIYQNHIIKAYLYSINKVLIKEIINS